MVFDEPVFYNKLDNDRESHFKGCCEPDCVFLVDNTLNEINSNTADDTNLWLVMSILPDEYIRLHHIARSSSMREVRSVLQRSPSRWISYILKY